MNALRAVVAALALLSGCAGLYPTPPHPPGALAVGSNCYLVDAHLVRCAQPTAVDLTALHDRFEVCRYVQVDSWWEAATVRVPGVETVRIPLPTLSEPSAGDLDAVAHAIDDSPCRVAISCLHGEDRTGLEVALYRVRRNGWTVDAAWAEAERHGFHRYRGVWRAWLHAAGWGP